MSKLNGLYKDQGKPVLGKPVRQGTDIESMPFNGQAGSGVNRDRVTDRFSYNQQSGVCNEGALINMGSGPRVASKEAAAKRVGPPATKDAFYTAPTTASGPKNIESGSRKWSPDATQNYVGNPDKINVGSR